MPCQRILYIRKEVVERARNSISNNLSRIFQRSCDSCHIGRSNKAIIAHFRGSQATKQSKNLRQIQLLWWEHHWNPPWARDQGPSKQRSWVNQSRLINWICYVVGRANYNWHLIPNDGNVVRNSRKPGRMQDGHAATQHLENCYQMRMLAQCIKAALTGNLNQHIEKT